MSFFEKRAKHIIEPNWRHGRYFDMWSFIHFITGTILGVVALILNISFSFAIILAIILMILYEGVEIVLSVSEDFENAVSDVFIGAMGFSISYLVISRFLEINLFLFLIALFIINILLFQSGWNKYLKKKLKR